jgi:hypothetical protein
MKKDCIEISINDHRKSLPDVAYNSVQDIFFTVWAAAPGDESQTADYFVSGQIISSSGEKLGETIDILKTEDIIMLPRVLYNPNKNQYLVIYCLGLNYFNIHGVILDEQGRAVREHFRIVDAPANQFHYTLAFNSTKDQYLVTYNDFRDEISSAYGVILDDCGKIIKEEFVISDAVGHQVNPVVCYNPKDDKYLINWEDFRAHGDSLEALETLEVMTDIFGALLSSDGTILANNIPMCMDSDSINADQRFNGITYNSKTNQFLVSWTDTRDSLQNTGVVGRIVNSDGSMPEEDFPIVDAPGAQMINHAVYVPGEDKYFIAFERDLNELNNFYFKDITANLNIAAMWLDADGRPESDIIDIFNLEGNHRFVRFAHSSNSKTFLLVWQTDFSGVSDSEDGHIMSAGGNIMGRVYKR